MTGSKWLLQQFLDDNRDLIEDENFSELFLRWYDEMESLSWIEERANKYNLAALFVNAGIDILNSIPVVDEHQFDMMMISIEDVGQNLGDKVFNYYSNIVFNPGITFKCRVTIPSYTKTVVFNQTVFDTDKYKGNWLWCVYLDKLIFNNIKVSNSNYLYLPPCLGDGKRTKELELNGGNWVISSKIINHIVSDQIKLIIHKGTTIHCAKADAEKIKNLAKVI